MFVYCETCWHELYNTSAVLCCKLHFWVLGVRVVIWNVCMINSLYLWFCLRLQGYLPSGVQRYAAHALHSIYQHARGGQVRRGIVRNCLNCRFSTRVLLHLRRCVAGDVVRLSFVFQGCLSDYAPMDAPYIPALVVSCC